MCGFYHSFNVQVKNKVSKLLKSTIYSFKGKLIQFSLMVITISYKSLLSTCTPLQFDFKFVLGHKTYFFVTVCSDTDNKDVFKCTYVYMYILYFRISTYSNDVFTVSSYQLVIHDTYEKTFEMRDTWKNSCSGGKGATFKVSCWWKWDIVFLSLNMHSYME